MTQDLVSRLRDEAARSTMCALAHGNQMRRESDRVKPAAVMREAADALEHLQADEAALRELLDDARTALSVLQPSCLADEELKDETLAAIDAVRSK